VIANIAEEFNKHKIKNLQLDPYGVCNARCWFCPVKYQGNPAEGRAVMSPELLEKIIKNIISERDKQDGLVSKDFRWFYTSHYNEILLYPHLERLLQLCEQYEISFMLLSNGTPLTPDKVDLIKKYGNAVNGIHLNIPAFERDVWSKRSGMNPKLFDKLISNLEYATKEFSNKLLIRLNGANNNSFSGLGGWLDKGPDFPVDMDLDVDSGELATQLEIAKKMFPNTQIYPFSFLIDRAGNLSEVITNKHVINTRLKNNNAEKRVIGCNYEPEIGGRPVGWLHINSIGKVFLCCNDYDMENIAGDLSTHELADFWGKLEHQQMIQNSYDTICRNCVSAIYEK
jgi:sulfatase maturation enzyme AslB (radical SAM superfamily)